MRRQSWWHVVCANSCSSGNDRLVLLAMSLHANFNGYVGISRNALGDMCNLSDKSVRCALRRLVKRKELFLFWQRTGRGNHNVYHITVSTFKLVDREACKVGLIELPKHAEFPPLRMLEEPPIKRGV